MKNRNRRPFDCLGLLIFRKLSQQLVRAYWLLLYLYLDMIIKKTNSQMSEESAKSSNLSNRGSKKVPETFTKNIKKSIIRSREQTVGVTDIFKVAMQTFICGICDNNVNRADTLIISPELCQHRFCTECFTQYAIYKINVSEQVLCPEQGCLTKMSQRSELFQALPEQLQLKWKQQELWRQTINNPDIKICPKQNCHEGVVDLLKDPPECRKCNAKFCKECMMEVHEGPCDENFQDHFREWKRCPKCKMFIQKDEGCNHMTCNCGHQFCFVCLSDWENSHYQCIDGLGERMLFNDRRDMGCFVASLLLVPVLLLFPLIVIWLVLLSVICLVLGVVGGVLAAPCIACQQCAGVACICCLIALPFVIAAGAIAGPIFAFYTIMRPYGIRTLRQYCNTVSFLTSQI